MAATKKRDGVSMALDAGGAAGRCLAPPLLLGDDPALAAGLLAPVGGVAGERGDAAGPLAPRAFFI